jgi:hypothetical protein
MKLTSRLQAVGHTCIAPSTPLARRSSSCYRPTANLWLRSCFAACAVRRATAAPVINVDGHPAYASAIAELKQTGELGRPCRCRTAPYLNNIIEQDHRFIKKRIRRASDSDQWKVRADDRGIRGHACHPKRPGSLGTEGRYCRPATIHPFRLRHRCVGRPDTQAIASLLWPFATERLGRTTSVPSVDSKPVP